MRKPPFIIGILIAFLLIPIKSLSASYITDCTAIRSSGEYILENDIIDSTASNCIEIWSSYVTLDCQGHRIDGVGAYGSYGIYISPYWPYRYSYITIKNCVLTDWLSPISISASDYVTLSNITTNGGWIVFYYCNNNRISNVSGSSPIEFYYSDYNTVEDSVFGDVVYDVNENYMNCHSIFRNVTSFDNNLPIVFYNSPVTIKNWNNNATKIILCGANNSIIDNLIMTQKHGLYVLLTNFVNITNSIFDNSVFELMYSRNNTLSNITISHTDDGIFLYVGSDYNYLTGIKSFENLDGIHIWGAQYTIIENSIIENNQYGIDIWSSSYDTIKNSIIKDNRQTGIRIYDSTGSLIYNNFFNNSLNFIIVSASAYWNTTLTPGTNIVGGSYIGGNYWGSPDDTGYSDTCSDSNNDGICDNPYTLATDNIDYLPLAKYVAPSPPTTTTIPTTTTTTTIPLNYTAPTGALVLIPMLLGNPLFFAIVFGLAIAASIEKKVNSGGKAFLLTFLGVLIMFSIFSGIVPFWLILVLIVLVIGGIVYFRRGS